MGTGMQTGIRTQTSPTQGKPSGNNFMEQAQQFWNGLSSKQRIIGISIIALMIAISLTTSLLLKANKFVALYPSISDSDFRDIQAELTKNSIKYEVNSTDKMIFVKPSEKSQILAGLTDSGYPREAQPIGNKENMAIKSPGLESQETRERLQWNLADVISRLEGVSRAKVNLVIPDKAVFQNDQEPSKAAVVISMKSGYRLGSEQAKGIANLVAASVDRLDPKNVTLIDEFGRQIKTTEGEGTEVQIGNNDQRTKELEASFKEKIDNVL